ncbi:TetR/AcrR family transcriptional regulator [Plantactinospora endophytica]|uniref:TetR family transcriptional regulator n=1 Tax=Plantactinospora endophytica TaxID=673535 RepID=A0ABQ4E0U3_9ACTN|nr:TetR/AcrR family transcriptional regulator [Plantactinospora endophytica]GIG87962.1 TetR family transcriptional regulator [Plantactinospora endophytica]
MVRLSRVQQQERTRAAVLAAARQEFTERGYVEAKIDRIAERAEMTRGAVYSNFPSKRALYLAVLIDMVERTAVEEVPESSPTSVARALGSFARAWLERLPLVGDAPPGGHLQLRSLSGVLDDEPARTALAQVIRLEALLLARTLEAHLPPNSRRVRLAQLVLTVLNGSAGLAETAPGFGDPFDVAAACEHLAGIDLADVWNPPHLPYVPSAQPCDDTWAVPTESSDQVTGNRVNLDADGVIVVLGVSRLAAAEEAVRAARPNEQVTVIVVTSDPAETGRLVRLRIGDLTACLRRVFAADAWPPLRLVLDDRASIATAVGLPDVDDETEAAVRVENGRIVARAEGRGAGHAAATAGASNTTRSSGSGA